MVKVSIVVPIFNVETYIEKCVMSLLAQTFTDMEIILVNDGSTDASAKICENLANKHPEIRYYSKENGGLSDARNFGLKVSYGQYLAFVDSDDFVSPDYVQILYDALKQNHADIAMCGFYNVDAGGNRLSNSSLHSNEVITGKDLVKRKILEDEGWDYVVAWNKLFDKSCLPSIPFVTGKYFEDEYSLISLYWDTRAISIVRDPLYYYVNRPGSIIKSSYSRKKMLDAIQFFHDRISFFHLNDRMLEKASSYDYCLYLIFIGIHYKTATKSDISELRREIRNNYCLAVHYSRGSLGMKAQILMACIFYHPFVRTKRLLQHK